MALARFSRTPQRARYLEQRRAGNSWKNVAKTEAREARKKSQQISAFGGKMAPNIDPGGLFWTSGGALARQAAAGRDKGQEKRAQDRPKSGPRAAKTAPRAAQERSGHLLPGALQDGMLLRGPIFKASAASSAAFRGAASTASPPFQSTAPEAKIAKECQNQKPAHRPSKQPLATKRLASKRWSAVSRR